MLLGPAVAAAQVPPGAAERARQERACTDIEERLVQRGDIAAGSVSVVGEAKDRLVACLLWVANTPGDDPYMAVAPAS
jgi:hypothetical protein